MLKKFIKVKKLIPIALAFMIAGCFCPTNSTYATTVNEVDRNCEENIQFNLKSNFEFHYIFKDIDKKLKANEQLDNGDNRILPRFIALSLLNKAIFEQIKTSLENCKFEENIKKCLVEEIGKLKEDLGKYGLKKEEIEKICSRSKECFENIDIKFNYPKIPKMLFDSVSEPVFTFSENDQNISTIIDYTINYKMPKIEETGEVKGPKEIEETKKKREIVINTIRGYISSILYNILNETVNENKNMPKLIDKIDAKRPYILNPNEYSERINTNLSKEKEKLSSEAEIEEYKKLLEKYKKLLKELKDQSNVSFIENYKENLKNISKESVGKDKDEIIEVVNQIIDKLKPYISSKEKTVNALEKFKNSVKNSKDKVEEVLNEIKKLIEDKNISNEDKNIIKSLDGCDTSEEGLKKLENQIKDSEGCLNRARKIFSNAQSYKDALLNSQSAEEYYEEIKKIIDEIELTKLYIY